jgi:hypothetical protein
MARRQFELFTAVSIAVAVLPSVTCGQPPYGAPGQQQQQQPQVQKQEWHSKGELEAAGVGGFKAVLDGQPWLVKIEPKAKVSVKGTATADALAPGQFVKFKGEFDKKGKASETIKELEIFTPNEKEPLGATPSGNAFETPMPNKKGVPTAPAPYEIAGRITGIKKGAITVACPGMTVHAEVAPDAAITVDIADPTVASPGDKIEVKGWYAKGQEASAAAVGRGYANEVEVKLSNQLTGPKKKGTRAAKPADKSTESADSAAPSDKKPAKGAKPIDSKPDPAKSTDAKKTADDKKPGDAEPPADKDKAAAAK